MRSRVATTTFRHLAGALALALALGTSMLACKKGEGGASGGAAPAGPKTYRFAFVTNNSTDFWNIARSAALRSISTMR